MSSQRVLEGTARRLAREVASAQSVGRIPSIVAGVVRGGSLVWSGVRGRVDGVVPGVNTQYRIGSITKTFVGVMVMRLRDEGLVDLSDPLDKYVAGTALGDRTVAQLLSHTSGAAAELPGSWWERSPGVGGDELVERMSGGGVALTRGGRRHHYSNPGFGLLGALVERVRGASWTEVLSREVTGPLGMSRTTPLPEAPSAPGLAVHPWADVVLPEAVQDTLAMGPAGQLWSTVGDLGRWAAFLGGDTGGVLAEDTLEEMAEPQAVADGDEWVSGYGLGVQVLRVDGRRLRGHGGSMPGFLAGTWMDPESGVGAVSLMNCTSSPAGGVSTALLSAVLECEPAEAVEWVPEEGVDRDLLALTGAWYWGPSAFVLRLRPGGWLELSPVERGRASRFRPNGDGTWTGLDGYYAGESLRVVRDGAGGVRHLDVATFVLTREPYGPVDSVPGGVDPRGWR